LYLTTKEQNFEISEIPGLITV